METTMSEPHTTADLIAALREEEAALHVLGDCPHGTRALLLDAAARLERPRFSAEQVEAVAKALGAYEGAGLDDCPAWDNMPATLRADILAEVRAALAAIGDVDDAR